MRWVLSGRCHSYSYRRFSRRRRCHAPLHCERAGDLLLLLLGLRALLLLRLLLGLRLLLLAFLAAAGEPERAGDLDGERAGLLLRLLRSFPRLLLLLRERLGV